jgi:hypothetical protein
MPRGVYERKSTASKVKRANNSPHSIKPAPPAISGDILTGEERKALVAGNGYDYDPEPTGGQSLVDGVLALIERLSTVERRQVAHALLNML